MLKGDIVVAVFNADGTQLLGGATLPAFTLRRVAASTSAPGMRSRRIRRCC